jgi:hypothetical protein
MIDQSLDELSKLIVWHEENHKKTRKDRNTIKKIRVIRETIQDSALFAKLEKLYSNRALPSSTKGNNQYRVMRNN